VTSGADRVIMPTSIYAPGTLRDAALDPDGAATGTPPDGGHPAGPGAGPAAGYPAPPGYSPPMSGYGPPPAPGPAYPGYPGQQAFHHEQQAAPGPGPVPGHAQHAGYGDPGYGPPAHHPASPPGPGPDQPPYGETINGGGYAYVIREDRARAPQPPGPPRPERDAGSNGTQPPAQEPPAFIAPEPPAPALDEPPAEPATAYGPDDPGYGPPRPEWYAVEDQAGQQAAEELQETRGAFEPPARQGESEQEPASQRPVGFELPGAGGATPLEQLRNFYQAAEATGPENLDGNFGQLLERQRQLISEYFSESALQESSR
jgi:hypothetical protein